MPHWQTGLAAAAVAGDGMSWARQGAELNAHFEQYVHNRKEDG
jgi:hypothetical protein